MDLRFTQDAGEQVFTGSELLVKGALETEGGVDLYTGAPGVPLRGYFDALVKVAPLLAEQRSDARIAPSGAAAVAMLNGAQLPGRRGIAAVRSTGLAAAVTSLTQGILTGTDGGGGVIVCGDDPWHDVTAAPFDSRFLAEHVRLPLLEPASPQEIKDWIDLAFHLGRAGRIYIGMLLSSSQAEGGGTVRCRPNQFAHRNEQVGAAQRDVRRRLAAGEAQLEQRLAAVITEARRLSINRILNRPQKGEVVPLGFVASGSACAFLMQALAQMGLSGRVPILKLGLTYPLDEQVVTEFARQCRRLIVIEERRSFVERQIVQILSRERRQGAALTEVFGKQLPDGGSIPEARELHPSLLMQRLIPVVRDHPVVLPRELSRRDGMGLDEELRRIEQTEACDVRVGERQPTFCAGCPHRDTTSVLVQLKHDLADAQYMLEHYKRKPVDLVCHADAGCSSLLVYEPNAALAATRPGRGVGGATAGGAGQDGDNRQLVFMGDGTFHQSGQGDIAHAIHTGRNVTFVILDNKTTAMTGRHRHADAQADLMGRKTFAYDIARAVEGMVPKKQGAAVNVIGVDPTDRQRYRNLLEQMLLTNGVNVIVADKECGITYHRRQTAKRREQKAELGYLPKQQFMNIAADVCEACLECTRLTGCTGLMMQDTDYGPKVQTDLSACVNDRACQRIGACPAFELVTVSRTRPSTPAGLDAMSADLPAPPRPLHADADTWRCFLAGVGGMGVGAATAVLAAAGREMGYDVQFIRHNGVAVRNGGVYSQLVYSRAQTGNGHPLTTAAVPYGRCDLVLGIDLLEAARGIDPNDRYRVAAPDVTAAAVNTHIAPTVTNLMGMEELDPTELDAALRRATHPNRYFGCNAAELSERLLGAKRYTNVLLLGAAYQSGYMPLTQDAIERAIRQVMSAESGRNLQAFAIGRQVVVDPSPFVKDTPAPSLTRTYARKVMALRSRQLGRKGREEARRFRRLVRVMRRAVQGLAADEELARDAIIRAYDCMVWGGITYAERYCHRVMRIAKLDDAEHGYQLTQAVVWNLARVMLIKDEVYVSSLLTSPEKYESDRRRFNVDPTAGDKVHYRHFHQPEFVLFGRHMRFEWTTRDWQLRIMARMRWLRRVLPGWHTREQRYRDWFEALVDQVDWHRGRSPREYQRWLAILQTPQSVSGYREVWYPRMEAARRRAEELLATDPQLFEPPAPPVPRKSVSLPIANHL